MQSSATSRRRLEGPRFPSDYLARHRTSAQFFQLFNNVPYSLSRRLFSLTVEPLMGQLVAELNVKLESEISLGFSGRLAADLAGRAWAFQSMVGAGMDLAKAAGLAGLMEVEA